MALSHPKGGESLGESLTVTWQGRDEDGDELTYRVLYSQDGGTSWQTLAVHWPESSYTVEIERLPGSSQGRFRVIAHDGVHTGQDDSDEYVEVLFHAPQVQINFPEDGAELYPGQTFIFNGAASIPDGQVKSEGSYQWNSSLDGHLGTGLEILPFHLSAGTHVITVSVSDSGGLTGETSIRITVLDESAPRAVEPGELPGTDSGVVPSYLLPGKVSGRAITAPVAAIQGSILTVLTDQGQVSVQVNANTRISAPPDADARLDSITVESPTRLAVLTDRVHTSENTAVSKEPITELKEPVPQTPFQAKVRGLDG